MSLRRSAAVLAAAALLAAPLVAAGSAGASTGYRLMRADTDEGTAVMRWNPCQPAITYKVNTTYARERGRTAAAARTRARSEIIAAVGRLSKATGIAFQFTGTTTHIPTGRNSWWQRQDADDEIVISYVDQRSAKSRSTLLSSGALGVGGQVFSYEQDDVVIGRGFVVLDAVGAAKIRSGFGPGVRRGNLVLHELGHVMGLDHVADRRQLMHPGLSDRSPDGFAAGDRAGLARLGRGAGCIAAAPDLWPGS